jgi:hypothetical protein
MGILEVYFCTLKVQLIVLQLCFSIDYKILLTFNTLNQNFVYFCLFTNICYYA